MNIAVIGGGPAGASLSLLLAEAGLKPLLFDGSHPREKPCGGALTENDIYSWVELQKIKDVRIFDGNRYYTTAGGHNFMLPGDPLFNRQYLISRKNFDRYLVNKAESRGAKWIKSNIVTLEKTKNKWNLYTRDGKPFNADFIVGADGVNSIVRKNTVGSFNKQDLIFVVGYRFKDLEIDYSHTVLQKDGSFGFLLPGFNYTQALVAARNATGIRRTLDDFVSRHFNTATEGEYFAACQPAPQEASFFNAPRSGDGFILLGDAAGFCNVATFEGLRYSIISAHEAAASIINEAPHEYESRWRDTFGQELIETSKKTRIKPPPLLIESAAFLFSRSSSLAVTAHSLAQNRINPMKKPRISVHNISRSITELITGGSIKKSQPPKHKAIKQTAF